VSGWQLSFQPARAAKEAAEGVSVLGAHSCQPKLGQSVQHEDKQVVRVGVVSFLFFLGSLEVLLAISANIKSSSGFRRVYKGSQKKAFSQEV